MSSKLIHRSMSQNFLPFLMTVLPFAYYTHHTNPPPPPWFEHLLVCHVFGSGGIKVSLHLLSVPATYMCLLYSLVLSTRSQVRMGKELENWYTHWLGNSVEGILTIYIKPGHSSYSPFNSVFPYMEIHLKEIIQERNYHIQNIESGIRWGTDHTSLQERTCWVHGVSSPCQQILVVEDLQEHVTACCLCHHSLCLACCITINRWYLVFFLNDIMVCISKGLIPSYSFFSWEV